MNMLTLVIGVLVYCFILISMCFYLIHLDETNYRHSLWLRLEKEYNSL